MSRMITVRLSDDRVSRLDALVARGTYPTRAAAVTAALDAFVAAAEQKQIDQAIVEGYTRIPPTPDQDGWAGWSADQSIREEPW